MYIRNPMPSSTDGCWKATERLQESLDKAEAVVLGAGAGLSASAGFDYAGERFRAHFQDFAAAYPFTDMYAGGFYPYETLEEYWAYWSRYIQLNRYTPAPKPVYDRLLELVANKDYFVLTTNVDHQFQKAGFDKRRLFYTQGDYGLWQCSRPCHDKTYDNEGIVQKMVDQQKNRRVPTELIPRCPVCGRPMTMNLRCDDRFVQDEGWYAAQARYAAYLREHQKARTLYWELGVGGNTPGIIQYPFRRLTLLNPKAVYACVNLEETAIPREIAGRSLVIRGDIGEVLNRLKE